MSQRTCSAEGCSAPHHGRGFCRPHFWERKKSGELPELDEATARVDAMLVKVADLKSLLLERRAALITDVVTGKKEVA